MDADLAGMRAFVAAAEELHFGRAAARLFLTQQALSKRIGRLEEALGAPLFERTTRSVALTPAGHRLLPLALDALDAFDTAVEAVRGVPVPLRVDVYHERFTPMEAIRRLVAAEPSITVEPSMRQGLAAAVPALLRREIDAAFGRAHDLGRPWPDELARRLFSLVPLHAFVLDGHPLATRRALTVAELKDAGIVMPDPGASTEWHGYLTRLAAELGVPLRFAEPAIGMLGYRQLMERENRSVAVAEKEMTLPSGDGMVRIPIVEPVPLFPWSIVWHRQNRAPSLVRLLALLEPPAVPDGPSFWLPALDLRWAREAGP
ncbi:LysR family transcriptional regulator [Actinomadura roseirufa]|uniref:LysR family transcriptional regulator n=1 Tax=Actinomadura roseirufa TaxID=2094049 RepID=UPI0010417EAB|nr:LysR family transcriptional regulator [Actinomadura roseirufa]